MIITKIEPKSLYDGTVELSLITKDKKAVQGLMDRYKPDKKYVVEIKQYRKNRSMDANAYCWVLCRNIAEHDSIMSTDLEIYRQAIIDYGVAEIVPIKLENAEEINRQWCVLGAGYSIEILGDSKLDGYVNVKRYWGSSTYNTKQMARLIDGLIYEAKELGIDTMTPKEVERMKQLWGAQEGCNG